MKKYLIIFVFIFSLLSLFWFATSVQAQVNLSNQITTQIDKGAGAAGLGQPTSPQLIIVNIITFALGLFGSIFLALVVYGGFLYINSRGEEETVNKAKKIIVGSIIGLTIVFLSYTITLFVGGEVSGEKVDFPEPQLDDFIITL
ncbi:MAG: hypothetical protein ABIJ23_02955 [Candidatus Magasanikbacteria bacterium]